MERLAWSDKQQQLIDAIWNNDIRIVSAVGPVRAGKSWPASQAFGEWLTCTWADADFGIVAASAQRVEALLLELEDIAAVLKVRFARRKNYVEFGTLRGYYWVSRHRLSYRAVRGHTFCGVLADEAKDLHPNCVREINNRCSLWPSKIVLTTNPGGPLDRYKLTVVDPIERGDRNGISLTFCIDDNPALSTEYKAELLAGLPPGPIRDRDYYGLWAQAGGLVIPHYRDALVRPPRAKTEMPQWCYVGVDPATVGVIAALLIGVYSRGRAWVLDEWRWDGREQGLMPAQEACDRITRRLISDAPAYVPEVIVDPADPAFADKMATSIRLAELPARIVDYKKPPLMPSLRALSRALGSTVFIDPKCHHLADELAALAYDADRLELTGEEKPWAGSEDHLTDCARYVVDHARLARSEELEALF